MVPNETESASPLTQTDQTNSLVRRNYISIIPPDHISYSVTRPTRACVASALDIRRIANVFFLLLLRGVFLIHRTCLSKISFAGKYLTNHGHRHGTQSDTHSLLLTQDARRRLLSLQGNWAKAKKKEELYDLLGLSGIRKHGHQSMKNMFANRHTPSHAYPERVPFGMPV